MLGRRDCDLLWRDAMVPIVGKTPASIEQIRAGTYDPDESQAGRVQQIAGDVSDGS